MLYLIQGRPRSGKSYEAVKYHLVPSIQKGRKVITNLPIQLDEVRKIYGIEAADLIKVIKFDYSDFDAKASNFPFSKPEDYMDDWRNEDGQGPLYIVDEAHFSLPKGGTLPEVQKFYTMHGHYGVDILLMTQHIRQIDVMILNLVEVCYKTVKNTAFGHSKSYVKKVQMGYRGDIVNTELRQYDKSIFPLYNSHTASAKSVIEAEAKDIKPFYKRWFMIFPVFILVGVVTMCSAGNPMDQTNKAPVVSTSQHQPVTPKRSISASEIESRNKKPPKEEEPEPTYHPFKGLQIHVLSEYTAGAYGSEYNMIFSASRGGIQMFTFDLKDLVFAGYEVSRLASCIVSIRYQKFEKTVFCDSPQVQITNQVGKAQN